MTSVMPSWPAAMRLKADTTMLRASSSVQRMTSALPDAYLIFTVYTLVLLRLEPLGI